MGRFGGNELIFPLHFAQLVSEAENGPIDGSNAEAFPFSQSPGIGYCVIHHYVKAPTG